uniref:Uncharacterized protein n=1 Tax=Romanomermis culicivorax TaxID=13658 RepID=A0A915HT60_ROMCU
MDLISVGKHCCRCQYREDFWLASLWSELLQLPWYKPKGQLHHLRQQWPNKSWTLKASHDG